jgi:hypothetical protein
MLSIGKLATLAAVSAALLTACTDDNNLTGVYGGNGATIRFVNATGTALDFTNNGAVDAGNGNVGFAGNSTCMQIDATNPNVAVRPTGSSTTLTGFSTSSLVGGGSYTVVAYPTATGGIAFATLGSSFTTPSGQGGLRVFNAVPGNSFDVYVTTPGAALGTANATNVTYGNASNFFGAAAGAQQVRITNAGSSTVAANVASQTFTAGQSSTLVIAPAASVTTGLRTFFVNGC